MKTECRVVVPQARGRRQWEGTAHWCGVSFSGDKNVLELGSGDDCTAWRVY